MKNTINLNLRTYPVVIEDTRNPGMVEDDAITLEKSQLQAAQIVGQSATELIYRLYNRKGFKVLEIGKPIKDSIPVDLDKLAVWVTRDMMEQDEQAKWNYLHGIDGERGGNEEAGV